MRLLLHSTHRRVALLVLLVVVAVSAGAAGLAQRADATTTTLKTFTTPGTYTWTVPTGVTNATFDVFGARGGSVLQNNHGVVTVISRGGAGGEAKATFAVKAGQVYEVVVGGQGGNAVLGTSTGSPGFNGGGRGSCCGSVTYVSGGGGGGSDVRIGGRGNNCVLSLTCGYGGRIVVGGGGGGGAQGGADGDNGGGLTGTPDACGGPSYGESGAQNCFGESDIGCETVTNVPGFGTGGDGCAQNGWGGAGGGWEGGASAFVGAGGGSGYISRFARSGSFPGGTNQGDGKVIITTTT